MTDCVDCAIPSTSYATIEDLQAVGLPPAALGGVDWTVQQKALLHASRVADTFLRDRYTLPIACPYDPALVDWVVQIAAYRLLQRRGFNPNGAIDTSIALGYQDAIKSLTRVANGQQQLCVVQSSPQSLQPEVGTNISRGYGGPGGLDYPVVGPNNAGF